MTDTKEVSRRTLPPQIAKNWMTVVDAAEALQMSYHATWNLTRMKEIASDRFGGLIIVSRRGVAEYLKKLEAKYRPS